VGTDEAFEPNTPLKKEKRKGYVVFSGARGTCLTILCHPVPPPGAAMEVTEFRARTKVGPKLSM